jgi:hypothetical protein
MQRRQIDAVGRGIPFGTSPVELLGRLAVPMSKALPKSGSALSSGRDSNGRLKAGIASKLMMGRG